MKYETVIGLEIHAELSTQTKAFCRCAVDFSADCNTNVCPVCTGMPGALPMLNERVAEYAVKAGLALNCKIRNLSRFDRKNYFYPDLSKGYQITQFHYPICYDGFFEIGHESRKKKIRISEIHIEEDAGKLVHMKDGKTAIDFNRSGVPLIEIVTAPDFRSADEAVEFLTALKELLKCLEISDGKMEEGSLRADVNLSVKPVGDENSGVRTEMKNLSSFKAVTRAINYESQRQTELIRAGKRIVRETRRWDEKSEKTISMRSKESICDYKYFEEPDLLPLYIHQEKIEEIRKNMPEFPEDKRKRFKKSFSLSEYNVKMLTASKEVADIFEKTVSITELPRETANFIIGDVFSILNENGTGTGKESEKFNIDEKKLAIIILMFCSGKISRASARIITEKMIFSGIEPEKYAMENELLITENKDEIIKSIKEVILENPDAVKEYNAGKEKVFGFLMGQIMKKLRGRVNHSDAEQILKENLNS